ncbi:MAG: RES family NAD+ phosphorylase [Balneolaceae bacterium]|nr:RES family NAD+ phosphorylase [Balneolaceae bacterium]
MNLFRISKKQYIRDLSGEGARKFGGRWNSKGYAVLYTSETESLAALETLVHASVATMPNDLILLVLSVPDNIKPDKIDVDQLHSGWRNYPAPNQLAAMGNTWIDSDSSLLLKVPSVLVQSEMNILINPNHSDADKLSIEDVRPFTFDTRFFQS